MKQKVQTKNRHYPTLKTMMTIANIIYESDTPINRKRLLEKLKNRVGRQKLNTTLKHLEKWCVICETRYGFVWTFNPTKKRSTTRKRRKI